MNFDDLQRRVRRAEALAQIRSEQTLQHWGTLERVWRSAWTPGRIVVAGLAGVFVAGKLEPNSAFSGARWLQMIGSVSGLVASAQASVASFAAAAAGMAAQQANEAADDTPPSRGTASAAAPHPMPPRAAEAATEVSEN